MERETSWPLVIAGAGATDTGRVREHNEDAVLVRADLGLYVVADGAGGHNAGNVASAVALASVVNYFEVTARGAREGSGIDAFGLRTTARRLSCAIQKANHDIVEIAKMSKEHHGMGSTIVALAVDPFEPVVHVAHVGDSRCYRARGKYLELLTEDHSLINEVLAVKPDMPDAALARLPRKVVTRALGMEETVRVAVRTFEVANGDAYLLCSDGLTAEVDDADLREALVSDASPEAVTAGLIAMANERGGSDNIAAIALRCVRTDAWERRVSQPRDSAPDDAIEGGSSPEILLLGYESGTPSLGALRTVPLDSASRGLFEALGTLVRRGFADTSRTARACKTCGARIDAEESYCPQCGTRA